jgi:hypothetical protein
MAAKTGEERGADRVIESVKADRVVREEIHDTSG